MQVSDAKRLRELEDENRRLKWLVADQALDISLLREVNTKMVALSHGASVPAAESAARRGARAQATQTTTSTGRASPAQHAGSHQRALESRFRARPARERTDAARADVIDEYSRESVALEVGTSLPAAVVTRALDRAIEARGACPKSLGCDNGTEFLPACFDRRRSVFGACQQACHNARLLTLCMLARLCSARRFESALPASSKPPCQLGAGVTDLPDKHSLLVSTFHTGAARTAVRADCGA